MNTLLYFPNQSQDYIPKLSIIAVCTVRGVTVVYDRYPVC
jgi:hypothetical protein